jgi:hypothetical protein
MAISFLFKIGSTDVTGHVVQNTYKVNNVPIYKSYEDANGETHRRFIRKKYKGTLKMVFKDLEEYAAFRALIDANLSATNYSVLVTLYDNLTGNQDTVNAFIDYEPTVKQMAGLEEYMEVIDVTIEER